MLSAGPGSSEGSPTAADDDEAVLAANSWRRHAPANTLRIDVRLQPHNAAAAAPVQRLCAVQEALLAAPTRAGGMLCFARADYKPSVRGPLPRGCARSPVCTARVEHLQSRSATRNPQTLV